MQSRRSKAKSGSKNSPCWPGYKRVPHTKPFTKGSCAPISKSKKTKKAA